MAWEYSQSTGEIKHQGILIAKGYSGMGKAKNKPDLENLHDAGPIPRGEWQILSPRQSDKTGKFVLPLEPVGHDAHGRSAFQIHGDSINNPGNASSGCIILNLTIRQQIWQSKSKKLTVVR